MTKEKILYTIPLHSPTMFFFLWENLNCSFLTQQNNRGQLDNHPGKYAGHFHGALQNRVKKPGSAAGSLSLILMLKIPPVAKQTRGNPNYATAHKTSAQPMLYYTPMNLAVCHGITK